MKFKECTTDYSSGPLLHPRISICGAGIEIETALVIGAVMGMGNPQGCGCEARMNDHLAATALRLSSQRRTHANRQSEERNRMAAILRALLIG